MYPTGALSDRLFRDAMACRRGWICGGVGNTRETTSADPDPIEFGIRRRGTIDIPIMASVGIIALGALSKLAGKDQAIGQRIARAIRFVTGQVQ